MSSDSRRRGRLPHNFGQKSPGPGLISLPMVDSSQRLTRKYKGFRPNSVDSQKHAASHHSTKETKLGALENNHRASEQVTAIPDPVPDTGFKPTSGSISPEDTPFYTFEYTNTHTITTKPQLSSLSTSSRVSRSFSIPSLLPMTSTVVAEVSTSTVTLPATLRPTTSTFPHIKSSPHGMTAPIIALIAVGSACVLVGAIIVIKACSRPKHKTFPVPSLPILDDHYGNDRFDTKESPVFGGEERFSSQAGTNSMLWTWTQYPQTKSTIERPAPALPSALKGLHGDPGFNLSYGAQAEAKSYFEAQPKAALFPRVQHLETDHIAPSSYRNSLLALTRAASRISTVSASLYPGSPIDDSDIVLRGGKAFTADGHPVIQRSTKVAMRRSRSNTLEERGERRVHPSPKRRSSELAYAGADVSSPQFIAEFVNVPLTMDPPAAAQIPSRTRIKSSYYTPGSYPRISSIPTSLNSRARVAPDELPTRPTLQKSESRREHDTRALAAALGFTSPATETVPPSPQPTLYPDDSMSVVEARRPSKRSHQRKLVPRPSFRENRNESTPSLPPITPTADAETTLGNLMLMDFSGATNKSLATITRRAEEEPNFGAVSWNSTKFGSKRDDRHDKPPHIPSPPPLPSLTQMGLGELSRNVADAVPFSNMFHRAFKPPGLR